MVLRGMFKVSDIFFKPNPELYFSTTLSLTCLESSFVFMVLLAWWCPLLGGAPCLVVLQTLGTFRTGVYILRSCDRSCDTQIAHRWTLSNYVTSEGNWLHQILFRGFIAKGVNTYALTTFFSFFCFFNFLKQVIFFISLHQFGLFCPLH